MIMISRNAQSALLLFTAGTNATVLAGRRVPCSTEVGNPS